MHLFNYYTNIQWIIKTSSNTRVLKEIAEEGYAITSERLCKYSNFTMVNEVEEIDLYRDTPVRYLGYANEVGEAFRSLIPKSLVWSTYGISSCYVLADTADKGYRVYRNDQSQQRAKKVMLSASDTLLWQAFASVIIPGFTINRICAAVQFAQRKTTRCVLKNPWIPTFIGLSSIPFIIHPIDHLVEEAMNATYRKWVGYSPEPKVSETKDK